MALMMECDECDHVQSVGIIDNGLPSGFPDPHHICENCGSKGRYSARGSKKRMKEQIENAMKVLPDLNEMKLHEQLETMFSQEQP